MGQKKKVTGKVVSQKELAPGIFDMWIETQLAGQAAPGQFIMVYPRGESTLLPRPISICEADVESGRLRIVYRVAGKGTTEFSSYGPGDDIAVMGTLGNGFPLEPAQGKRALLLGAALGYRRLCNWQGNCRERQALWQGIGTVTCFCRKIWCDWVTFMRLQRTEAWVSGEMYWMRQGHMTCRQT